MGCSTNIDQGPTRAERHETCLITWIGSLGAQSAGRIHVGNPVKKWGWFEVYTTHQE